MPAMTYLLKASSGKYFYRRVVPPELRAAVGKREIKIALHTTDRDEAKRRHSEAHRQACELIHRYRGVKVAGVASSGSGEAADALPERRLSPAQINDIACRWRTGAVTNGQYWMAFGSPLSQGERLAKICRLKAAAEAFRRNAMERQYPDYVLNLARRCLDEAGAPDVGTDSAEFSLTCYALALAFGDCMEAEAEWLAGNPLFFPTGPVLASPAATPGAGTSAPRFPGLTSAQEPIRMEMPPLNPYTAPRGDTPLSGAIERWFREKADMSPKTQHECRMVFRRLSEILGGDQPIGSVDQVKVVELKEALCMMPRSLPEADRRLPILEIVNKYKGQEIKRISAETVSKQIGLLQSFFGWAKDHKYVLDNYAVGLKPDKPKRGIRRRILFSSDDLRAIFSTPIYTGCSSARERLKKGPQIIRDEYFWLPLLGLYQGGRLNELGSLLVSEVKTEEGILFLELDVLETGEDSAEEDEAMKSYTSLRVSPVHPVVMACGFAEYVADLRRRGEARLFPNLKPDRFGTFTAQYSKWFGRFLTALGITERRKVFHSFRHNFKAACRRANLREDVHDRLTGHRNDSVGRQYGEDIPMCVLAEAMSKVQYPELDLSPLYTLEPKNG